MSEVNLLGRVGMDVEIGIDLFDREKDVTIVFVGLVRVDTTLYANFRRTTLDRVLTLLENLRMASIERVDGVVLVTGEPTERTADIADVRKVDIAADDVTDVVSTILLASDIGCRDQCMKIGPLDREQPFGIGRRKFVAAQGTFE